MQAVMEFANNFKQLRLRKNELRLGPLVVHGYSVIRVELVQRVIQDSKKPQIVSSQTSLAHRQSLRRKSICALVTDTASKEVKFTFIYDISRQSIVGSFQPGIYEAESNKKGLALLTASDDQLPKVNYGEDIVVRVINENGLVVPRIEEDIEEELELRNQYSSNAPSTVFPKSGLDTSFSPSDNNLASALHSPRMKLISEESSRALTLTKRVSTFKPWTVVVGVIIFTLLILITIEFYLEWHRLIDSLLGMHSNVKCVISMRTAFKESILLKLHSSPITSFTPATSRLPESLAVLRSSYYCYRTQTSGSSITLPRAELPVEILPILTNTTMKMFNENPHIFVSRGINWIEGIVNGGVRPDAIQELESFMILFSVYNRILQFKIFKLWIDEFTSSYSLLPITILAIVVNATIIGFVLILIRKLANTYNNSVNQLVQSIKLPQYNTNIIDDLKLYMGNRLYYKLAGPIYAGIESKYSKPHKKTGFMATFLSLYESKLKLTIIFLIGIILCATTLSYTFYISMTRIKAIITLMFHLINLDNFNGDFLQNLILIKNTQTVGNFLKYVPIVSIKY